MSRLRVLHVDRDARRPWTAASHREPSILLVRKFSGAILFILLWAGQGQCAHDGMHPGCSLCYVTCEEKGIQLQSERLSFYPPCKQWSQWHCFHPTAVSWIRTQLELDPIVLKSLRYVFRFNKTHFFLYSLVKNKNKNKRMQENVSSLTPRSSLSISKSCDRLSVTSLESFPFSCSNAMAWVTETACLSASVLVF